MLVLNRENGEALIITTPDGDTIRVAVVSVKGRFVGIGIEAPREYKILREELIDGRGRDR